MGNRESESILLSNNSQSIVLFCFVLFSTKFFFFFRVSYQKETKEGNEKLQFYGKLDLVVFFASDENIHTDDIHETILDIYFNQQK